MTSAPDLELLHTDDTRTHAAIHESGHALAYVAIGRGFQHIDMDPAPSWAAAMVIPHHRTIDAWSKAQVSMAGPVVEAFMFRRTIRPDSATVRLILERLDEALEAYAEAEEWGEDLDLHRSDYTDAGPHATAVLPWCLSLLTDNWSTVEAMARRVLDGERRITTHDELRPLLPEPVEITETTMSAWVSAWTSATGQGATR